MRQAFAVFLVLLLAGCTTVEGRPTSVPLTSVTSPSATTTVAPTASSAVSTTPAVPPTTTVVPPATTAPGQRSAGWQVTVYYTAVESFHSGNRETVRGCPKIDCRHGEDDLGSYPSSFVQAVQDEGTGRTAGGKYLNWSSDTGYWLDTAPRDTNGRPLEPFVSAAADGLAQGTKVRLVSCGRPAPDQKVCDRLSSATWVIKDAFTPGLGGQRHIDLYLGEETGPRFTEGPWYTSMEQAELLIG